jgi:hypothetical protein
MSYKRHLLYFPNSKYIENSYTEVYTNNLKEFINKEYKDEVCIEVTGVFTYEQENRRLKGIPF